MKSNVNILKECNAGIVAHVVACTQLLSDLVQIIVDFIASDMMVINMINVNGMQTSQLGVQWSIYWGTDMAIFDIWHVDHSESGHSMCFISLFEFDKSEFIQLYHSGNLHNKLAKVLHSSLLINEINFIHDGIKLSLETSIHCIIDAFK